jgi:hypothetical protein
VPEVELTRVLKNVAGNATPQNKWMQLTRSAHGQTGRGPRS